MFDVNFLSINRLIIHKIIAKLPERDTATVEYSDEVVNPNETVLALLKARLVDAVGRNSRAFELSIQESHEGTFFDLATRLHGGTNEEFIRLSSDIADSLADSQTRTNIPGGFLIVIDCHNVDTRHEIAVVIKAEPHEALQLEQVGGRSHLNLLEKVFLSPSQKLYKIGVVYRKEQDDITDASGVNDRFGCFIYDDQFRTESRPAEYFYDHFLGFSIGDNGKIQSQRFYEKSENFIKSIDVDYETKIEMLNALAITFTADLNNTISPAEFARDHIPAEDGIRDQFFEVVCEDLPIAIVKDKSLIRRRLLNRKIDFPERINVIGPVEGFDANVEIISDRGNLLDLDVDSEEYTIVKISGRPFRGNG